MSIQLTTLDEASNIVISILVMQVLKRLGELSSSAVWWLRAVFVASQVLQGVFLVLMYRSLSMTDDQRKVKVPKRAAENESEEEEITYNEYDMREYRRFCKSMALQLVISVFCHLKWNIIQPFIIQSIGPIKSFFVKPLFLAHVRRVDVLRPFEKNVLFQKAKVEDGEKKDS